MAHQNTPSERQLLKLVEKLPLAADDKTAWIEQIRSGGMTIEIGEDIRHKLEADQVTTPAERAHFEVELARLVRTWRLEIAAHGFKK